MKKNHIIYMLVFLCISLTSFAFNLYQPVQQMINFNVRGNGKTNLSLGIGYQVGSGACCKEVSKESTVGFQGNSGDILYDSQTKRVIIKVTKDLEGKTIDLREYY